MVAAACRAQARTIISGVGDLFLDYRGPIVFQGGVASNRAVAHYLQDITGNEIIIPEHHAVMGALGAAKIALDGWESRGIVPSRTASGARGPRGLLRAVAPPAIGSLRKSVAMRTQLTRREFLSRSNAPLVCAICFILPRSSMRWASAR